MSCSYDLATDSQEFVVEGITDDSIPPTDEKNVKKLLSVLKSILTIG